jgi:hypothetical protein
MGFRGLVEVLVSNFTKSHGLLDLFSKSPAQFAQDFCLRKDFYLPFAMAKGIFS